jgi:hypothetical protein
VADAAVCPEPPCAVLELEEPLRPQARYLVEVGGTRLAFATAADADTALPMATLTRGSSDGCLNLVVVADELSWAVARVGPGLLFAPGLGTRHELGASIRELAEGATVSATVELRDLAGNRLEVVGETAIMTAHPGWAIAEVLANPRGPEPVQEWVELLRVGSEGASLLGLRLGDESGQDELPDTIVGPGQRAVVASAGYDPTAPEDVAPAPGSVLVRISGSTIGQGGLANGGERVILVDAAGGVLSTFTARRDVSSSAWAGRSLERVDPAGCDVGNNVAGNLTHAATPGARNSVEK